MLLNIPAPVFKLIIIKGLEMKERPFYGFLKATDFFAKFTLFFYETGGESGRSMASGSCSFSTVSDAGCSGMARVPAKGRSGAAQV
jgi:hypothetical protein